MGNELVKSRAADLSAYCDGSNPPNPLLMLPFEYRQAAAMLWAANSHILPSALALCSRVRLYAEPGAGGHRLEPEDFRVIVARLLDPAAQAGHKFGGDLLAALAGWVARRLDLKATQAEMLAARAEDQRNREIALTHILGANVFAPREETD